MFYLNNEAAKIVFTYLVAFLIILNSFVSNSFYILALVLAILELVLEFTKSYYIKNGGVSYGYGV